MFDRDTEGVRIELRSLTKHYPGQPAPAVDDVTLDIPAGELVVLVGPSGCGKTTTMKMINRLVEPTSGEIRIGGQDVLGLDPDQLRRHIGYAIQQVGLFPHQTVAQNIGLVPKLLDTGVVYTETDKGQTCNFGEVFTTDGRIAALGLTVLEDDKKFFPIYNAAMTMRQETYEKYPALEKVLQSVIAKLDDATMQQLNARVDVEGEEPGKVSADWLGKQGLLGADA
ncbi:glycine betaine ABC transporter substrate-binding protein [Nonomuraea sp. NPDC048882]|uniref:glycine betaine ABC transporter substrate-binding protein n=1 Tax=unclassified Nonomuraea TaxID=2593643 RepID=UPI0033D68C9F